MTCKLCDLALPKHPIVDSEHSFCCMGCHAVFKILSAQEALKNYQETPLFQQALRSGLISNPELQQQIRDSKVELPEGEWLRHHLEIGGLWCPSCAEVIRLILLREKGIRQCVVDYATDLASIEYAPRHISKEKIHDLIKALGYSPSYLADSQKKAVSFQLYLRFAIAAFCALQIMMFSYPIYMDYFGMDTKGYGLLFGWLSCAASLPVVSYSVWPILQRFYNSLRVGLFGMETLVIIGVGTAFGMSLFQLFAGSSHVYFDSMSAIVVFVLLGKIIESRAKFSARDALLHIHRAVPRRGRKRFPDGTLKFVPLKEIVPGDCMVITTGEKIVMDGVVIEGEGAADESLMTGEFIPLSKKAGSQVLAGSMLRSGAVTIQVVRSIEQSLLQRIISVIEQDIGHKTHYVRAADLIVRWFVPLVVAIAAGAGLWVWLWGQPEEGKSIAQTAVVRAVAVLLISCPCAIGIAAPLAESLLMKGLASLGAIVRNRACLRFLGKETKMVFDKTGTLTEGTFAILEGIKELSSSQRALLKGLALQSLHPISSAVAESIFEAPLPFDRVEEFAGKGLRGQRGESIYHLGSKCFLELQQVQFSLEEPPLIHSEVVSQVFFAENGRCITTIYLGDRLRADAKTAVSEIGSENTILLSGDSPSAVAAVANLCGIPVWKAHQSPLEKRAAIEQLKSHGEKVLMIGDGINDAPALAIAHIGISVVSATDLSIQVSDILLTTDRLEVLPRIRRMAKKGHAIIRQNLFWAFIYNVIGIGLAVFGFFPPIVAALAMVLSSLIVLFNALRLKNEGEVNAN